MSIEDKFPILGFFKYDHLPPHLQAVSKPFGDLAVQLVTETEKNHESDENTSRKRGAETAAGLRKLLEAKDCFVRAALGTPNQGRPQA